MSRRRASRRARQAAWLLAAAVALPARAAGGETAPAPPQTQTAPARPRVFTNDDLKRYERPGAKPAPRAPLAAPEPPLAAPAPDEPLPPAEQRLEQATAEELRAREAELAALLEFLRAKERWLKNPLLPPPAPPAGETLTDPARSGGQQYAETRSRIVDAENRLLKVRVFLEARFGGG